MTTDFSNKVEILADLWMNYKDDEEFKDFFEYNDLGLPLAYFIQTDMVKPSEEAEGYIEETFNLLCAALGLDLDGEYENLNQMFDLSQQ